REGESELDLHVRREDLPREVETRVLLGRAGDPQVPRFDVQRALPAQRSEQGLERRFVDESAQVIAVERQVLDLREPRGELEPAGRRRETQVLEIDRRVREARLEPSAVELSVPAEVED